MNVIPCLQDPDLKAKIEEFAEILRTKAHELDASGRTEEEFFESGLFRGAIERIRGQFSATMRDKREFVKLVLNHMQDAGYIKNWESSGESNRHDYTVVMNDGRISAVELKGCLDGNNTTIFERPANAQEFVLWSICSNPNADPRHNVWSGIHTRLSTKVIADQVQVDGLVVWDWLCGSDTRPCPKLAGGQSRLSTLGQYRVPPPCIYLFPRTVPNVRSNPTPQAHDLKDVSFLSALHQCFLGQNDELSFVQLTVANKKNSVVRTTTVSRAGAVQKQSAATPIRQG